MEDVLHVLNGDATFYGFEQTGLEGDVMIWREILSQGPVQENISSPAFWKERANWIAKTFPESSEGFLRQLEKLYLPYIEINLWFDFDLHCQVNMLGVMMMLTKKTDLSSPAIYLICPDDFPGKKLFRGMGELNGEELAYLYDNIRVQLNDYDFILAAEAWQHYIKGNATELEKWLDETSFWSNLHCLKPALQAHLKRLQLNSNGLNYIEQKLLDICNSGFETRIDIYEAFWATEKIYGMGDLEIDLYLEKLRAKHLIR